MQPLIELLLLAAAVDGNIDGAERITILQSIVRHHGTIPITEAQITLIQRQLLTSIQQGHSRKSIMQMAAQSLDEEQKLLAYAVAVEVVLSNNELIDAEIEYLKLLNTVLDLHPEPVKSIHFSAKVRYGFGDFNW